jgi:hypothetical protein
LRASEGEVLDIDAFEDDLVLKLWAHFAEAAGEHVNLEVLLATEEVLDFDALAVLGNNNVNGEVSVYESHLVSVTLYINL